MEIGRMRAEHLTQMAELDELCFPVPWTLGMFKSELRNPVAVYYIAEEAGTVIGYAGMQVILDEGYITNVAVHPDFRRKGLARALLARLLEDAEKRELAFLTLEVRQSNLPAQTLYQSLGFIEVGLRPGYYHSPREDALLMTLYRNKEDTP